MWMRHKDLGCGDTVASCGDCGKKFEAMSKVVPIREHNEVLCWKCYIQTHLIKELTQQFIKRFPKYTITELEKDGREGRYVGKYMLEAYIAGALHHIDKSNIDFEIITKSELGSAQKEKVMRMNKKETTRMNKVLDEIIRWLNGDVEGLLIAKERFSEELDKANGNSADDEPEAKPKGKSGKKWPGYKG